MITWICTARDPIDTDTVLTQRTKHITTGELNSGSGHGGRREALKGARCVHTDLRAMGAGSLRQGALINVHTAFLWGPSVALVTTGEITAQLCVVTGETVTDEAFLTDTGHRVAEEGVVSLCFDG